MMNLFSCANMTLMLCMLHLRQGQQGCDRQAGVGKGATRERAPDDSFYDRGKIILSCGPCIWFSVLVPGTTSTQPSGPPGEKSALIPQSSTHFFSFSSGGIRVQSLLEMLRPCHCAVVRPAGRAATASAHRAAQKKRLLWHGCSCHERHSVTLGVLPACIAASWHQPLTFAELLCESCFLQILPASSFFTTHCCTSLRHAKAFSALK